ncbi:MAG: MBL fold metallo-hydrolase [Pirellulaceae bacterium]
MKLHCLGTAGYHPSESRHTSCYFLPESGIVFDAGTGIFRLPDLIQTETLDVLLSHTHLDHVVGLTYLLGLLYQSPVTKCRVWGEEEKLEVVRKCLFHRDIFPAELQVQWKGIRAGESFSLAKDARVMSFAMEHPGGSVGYRIDWPTRSMAYVTDTTADCEAAYVRKVRGVDLLLHECNFRSTQEDWAVKTGHSTARRVGQVAAAVGAKQTWLIHLNPMETDYDPVGICDAQAYLPNIQAAFDRQVIDF